MAQTKNPPAIGRDGRPVAGGFDLDGQESAATAIRADRAAPDHSHSIILR